MASQTQAPGEAPCGGASKNKQESSLNDRFFRYFQQEITALQEEMDRLPFTSTAGGETRDAIDHCLAGISRLSSEVQDASSYVPPYDQRIYAEAIKALQEKLAETRAAIAPRQKFAFKTARKNPSAVSLADMAELDAQGRRHIPGYRSSDNSSMESSLTVTPLDTRSPAIPGLDTSGLGRNSSSLAERTTVDAANGATTAKHTIPSDASTISVDSRTNVHLILSSPIGHRTVPVSITSLKRSVIDLINGLPFAAMAIKDVTDSLLMCGEVKGAAHITGVRNSVLAVSCHQFRMHDCSDVTVYLGCSSTPIIENCHNIRFNHIPNPLLKDSVEFTVKDSWSNIDDFSWLKMGQSPNWRVTDEKGFNPDDIWAKLSSGDGDWALATYLLASESNAA
ncbi:predicted protein [Uncinocarpus reesii 1704]|uniref:C-CAP/cofactor C-like domain-containing protein n=1 Tax=Uncinocarpus reesii (strain UAMH 1704) TaxID=336963 RepID=C4JZN6_UNCRE|nr:uncharacterized protein UREG_07637 [Uncinocarpus reesii 1704]EEP82772.1 predicted protein [Uncinocarpus reesii 1704]